MEGKADKNLKKENFVLNMDLEQFVRYSEIYKDKRMAVRLARSLIENLYYENGRYYNMGKRKVKDLYTLTAEDVFLKMKNYGIKTLEALNEVLTKNNLQPLVLRLDDISYHPHYQELHKS